MAGILTAKMVIYKRYLIYLENHKRGDKYDPAYLRKVEQAWAGILKFASGLEGDGVLVKELISFTASIIEKLYILFLTTWKMN